MLTQARYTVSSLCFVVMLHIGYTENPMRVLGGRDVEPNKYTYVVRMETQLSSNLFNSKAFRMVVNTHICTCSALTSTWTLTAAHCIEAPKAISQMLPKKIQVKAVIRYGSVYSQPLAKNTFSNIKYSVSHPNYKLMTFQEIQELMLNNDIGLLKTEPIILKEYGKISSVDYSAFVGQPVVMVGYGLMNSSYGFQPTLNLHKPLQVLDLIVKKCEGYELEIIYPSICTASRCGQDTGACPGDSGGPLLHASGIIGVNSLGDKFKCENHPRLVHKSLVSGFLTPVSPYLDWIMSVMSKEYPTPKDTST